MALQTSQSTVQVLALLPEQQLDRFITLLSPKALLAIQTLNDGAAPLQESVATEIAEAVWACLESPQS
jgi:hypothetical protein